GYPVHRFGQELRRAMVAIPAPVNGGITKTKVRGEVDHAPAATEQVAGETCGRPVRQRQEDQLTRGGGVGFRRPERLVDDSGQEGIHLGGGTAAVLLRGEVHELDGGMLREDAQQRNARVSGGAEHRDGRARRRSDRLHSLTLRIARGARNAAARINAWSTAAACAPCGARTSYARPRGSRG